MSSNIIPNILKKKVTCEKARDSGFLNRADFYGFGLCLQNVAQKDELVVCLLPPACADGNCLYYTHFTLKKKEYYVHKLQSGVSQVLPGVPLFLMSLTKLLTS